MQPQHHEYLCRFPSHVATELVRLYQTNENDKASSLIDSVLRGFKEADTHKETTLLVLGYIAKYVKNCVQPLIIVHRAKSRYGKYPSEGNLFDIRPDRKAKPCHPRDRIPPGE